MSGDAPVAAPPMYDLPEIAAANDALWAAMAVRLRANGLDAPEKLTRGGNLATLWRSPTLLFGQTCGYPYVKGLRDAVVLIATPEYAFPGCDGPFHRSFLVCSAHDARRGLTAFRGSVAAINSWDSNSGMNLFRATIAPVAGGRPFFSQVILTGSHAASLEAVAEGHARLAAIDCVSFGLFRLHRRRLVEGIACVAESPPTPGLPFITSARWPAATLAEVRGAFFEALADPALAEARATLGLERARALEAQAYQRVLDLIREAVAAGYPTLE